MLQLYSVSTIPGVASQVLALIEAEQNQSQASRHLNFALECIFIDINCVPLNKFLLGNLHPTLKSRTAFILSKHFPHLEKLFGRAMKYVYF